MTVTTQDIVTRRSSWIAKLMEKFWVMLITRIFSHDSVQQAFVDTLSCNSPMVRGLNGLIEEQVDEALTNLDIEQEINNKLDEFEIDADNVGHFHDAVTEILGDFRLDAGDVEDFEEAVLAIVNPRLEAVEKLTKPKPRPSYNIFFVLNGLHDGEEGVYAKTAGVEKQMADGWYWIAELYEDDDGHGPFRSRQAAVRAAEEAFSPTA